jgi:hypothetical protein
MPRKSTNDRIVDFIEQADGIAIVKHPGTDDFRIKFGHYELHGSKFRDVMRLIMKIANGKPK